LASGSAAGPVEGFWALRRAGEREISRIKARDLMMLKILFRYDCSNVWISWLGDK
jgi:hypothetical protein